MNFNFFEWIRDGVKRSVLLGVSDAVDVIGMPHDEETSRSKILHFLQEEGNQTDRRRLSNPANTSGGTRKLGRSIADIHPGK
ncbi:MAG: hypothetical protein ACRC10_05560 [Thermoguttaceae bacterium]